ncbi:major facilitator superfamily permease [Lacticaseibacillus paracasei subsp. tolerans DSM 20258]|nr:major facilitator superfamily permease [Lacticaseibacillus paracasei subsp. tolerans DSM 20258]
MDVKDINGKHANVPMMVTTLIVGTFITILNQTILSTAFPTLMKAFNISTATVQWLSTGFMLVNGIMIPVSAYLSAKVPSKWLYMSAMSTFFVGTLVAFIANSFGVLLIGRLIQALGVGITMPLLQNIMMSIFPPNRRCYGDGWNCDWGGACHRANAFRLCHRQFRLAFLIQYDSANCRSRYFGNIVFLQKCLTVV